MKRSAQEAAVPSKYKWRFEHDEKRDVAAYEITRDTDTVPHTVLVFQYMKTGPIALFSDIFYSDDWDSDRGAHGVVSDDIRFLCELWRELGLKDKLGEDFQPKHIAPDPNRAPIVYRNTLESVMAQKFGCSHRVLEGGSSDPKAKVIPLVFDVNDSDDVVQQKIMDGIKQGIVESE
jgi:hypothetical protein